MAVGSYCSFRPIDAAARVKPLDRESSWKKSVDTRPRGEENREFFAALLRKCGNSMDLARGRRVHARILASEHLRRSLYLRNLAIEMFGKCGEIDHALEVFRALDRPNVFSWNIMLAALSQNGHLDSARALFAAMPEKDVVSWNTMLAALAENPSRLSEARELFARMEELGSTSTTSWVVMIAAFTRTGDVSSGRDLFERIESKNTVVWTSIVSCYAQNGFLDQARDLFERMPERNLVSWNVMIAANAQTGQILKARELFDKMPERDVVAWTTIVTGYGQNGESKKAMAAFTAMDLEGVEANEMTFVSFFDACAATAAIAQGRSLHADLLLRPALWSNVIVKNAVLNFYGSCGEVETAREVFAGTSSWARTIVSWTAMATAYAHNGFGREAVEIFRAMVLEGVAPDGVSVVGMLYACNHAGMIEDGWRCLVGIEQDYWLAPAIAHYVCAINLLGRTGRLCEAEELINVMPFEPDFLAWNTLLAACRVHGDFDRAKHVAKCMFELQPRSYILLNSSG